MSHRCLLVVFGLLTFVPNAEAISENHEITDRTLHANTTPLINNELNCEVTGKDSVVLKGKIEFKSKALLTIRCPRVRVVSGARILFHGDIKIVTEKLEIVSSTYGDRFAYLISAGIEKGKNGVDQLKKPGVAGPGSPGGEGLYGSDARCRLKGLKVDNRSSSEGQVGVAGGVGQSGAAGIGGNAGERGGDGGNVAITAKSVVGFLVVRTPGVDGGKGGKGGTGGAGGPGGAGGEGGKGGNASDCGRSASNGGQGGQGGPGGMGGTGGVGGAGGPGGRGGNIDIETVDVRINNHFVLTNNGGSGGPGGPGGSGGPGGTPGSGGAGGCGGRGSITNHGGRCGGEGPTGAVGAEGGAGVAGLKGPDGQPGLRGLVDGRVIPLQDFRRRYAS